MLNTLLTILTEAPKKVPDSENNLFILGLIVGWMLFWIFKDKKNSED